VSRIDAADLQIDFRALQLLASPGAPASADRKQSTALPLANTSFDIGPATYTPGTKMPEQRIGAPEDRDALVKFLERATK
jgi:hypothetical protein